MRRSLITSCLALGLLSGCVAHDGTYSPNCMAFEGSNITLSGGHFIWEKFTDQVIVDDDGNVVDQFPDFPKRGTYEVDGDLVSMTSETGESMPGMYLHHVDDRHFLLTVEQLSEWEKTGEYPPCTLTLGGTSGN